MPWAREWVGGVRGRGRAGPGWQGLPRHKWLPSWAHPGQPFTPWPPGHSPTLEAARPCSGPRGRWAHIPLPQADKGASLPSVGLWLHQHQDGAAGPPGWCGRREAIRELGSSKRSRAPWTWGNPDHGALPRGLGLLPALWSWLGFRRDDDPQGSGHRAPRHSPGTSRRPGWRRAAGLLRDGAPGRASRPPGGRRGQSPHRHRHPTG